MIDLRKTLTNHVADHLQVDRAGRYNSERQLLALLFSKSFRPILLGLLLAWGCSLTQATALAQSGRRSPSLAYYSYIEMLHAGDYKRALSGFDSELNLAMRTADSRWVDSICALTMAGEAAYRMGDLNGALQRYNLAVSIYLVYPDWFRRVQFPATIAPSTSVRAVPWGTSARATYYGQFPETMLVTFGEQQIVENQPVVQPKLIPVNVTEIVRCTALSIRRRKEILGPAYSLDPLSRQLTSALSRRTSLTHPNHWSQGWIDLFYGLALSGDGNHTQAAGVLQRALQVGGQLDHPATAMVLCELGQIALAAGDLPTAAAYYAEATFPAAHYGDLTSLEEAFRYGQTIHLMSNSNGMFGPLEAASVWARTAGLELYSSLLILIAENYVVAGDPNSAAAMIGDVRSRIARSPMGQLEIGARLLYVSALIDYGRGNLVAGDKAISAAIQYYQSASLWLVHIATIDAMVASNHSDLSARNAARLYEALLREPTAFDWGIRPLESLAVLTTPHHGAYERWFEAAISHTGDVDALEIADRARRHRFQASQHLGGRMLALRWLLEAPAEMLDQRAVLRRQDLLARYPGYKQLADESRQIQETLRKAPLVVTEPDQRKGQQNALSQLAKNSAAQEAILRLISIRREAASLVFPPIRKTKEIQRHLLPKQLLLSFFETNRGTYAFLYSHDNSARWKIQSPGEIDKRMLAMFKSLGLVDGNRELTETQLLSDAWKTEASELTRLIFAGSRVNLAQGCEELIVVPDGRLWYLPFELLQVEQGSENKSLIELSKVRYAPTSGLAVTSRHGRKQTGTIAFALGKLYPRDDAAVAVTAFEHMQQALPGAVALSAPLPGHSPLMKTLFDGLVVLDDLAGTEAPFMWSPIPLDRPKRAGALDNWLTLPWGSPDFVVLPGFHTATENGLRRGGSGHEIFLNLCGLMATGTRTIVLSRWRTGGQTSFNMVREFVQELPNVTASDAWQRSIELTTEAEINVGAEPRVRLTKKQDTTPQSSHPFFWAGYMLVDPGVRPRSALDEDEPPLFDVQQSDAEQEKSQVQPAQLDLPEVDPNAAAIEIPGGAGSSGLPKPGDSTFKPLSADDLKSGDAMPDGEAMTDGNATEAEVSSDKQGPGNRRTPASKARRPARGKAAQNP